MKRKPRKQPRRAKTGARPPTQARHKFVELSFVRDLTLQAHLQTETIQAFGPYYEASLAKMPQTFTASAFIEKLIQEQAALYQTALGQFGDNLRGCAAVHKQLVGHLFTQSVVKIDDVPGRGDLAAYFTDSLWRKVEAKEKEVEFSPYF